MLIISYHRIRKKKGNCSIRAHMRCEILIHSADHEPNLASLSSSKEIPSQNIAHWRAVRVFLPSRLYKHVENLAADPCRCSTRIQQPRTIALHHGDFAQRKHALHLGVVRPLDAPERHSLCTVCQRSDLGSRSGVKKVARDGIAEPESTPLRVPQSPGPMFARAAESYLVKL